jgi:hypothetical protein
MNKQRTVRSPARISKRGRVNEGRPSSYQSDYCRQAELLTRMGATDKDLAEFFRVSPQTIGTWKHAHPEFLESLKAGKDVVDGKVVKSLLQRALGCSHPAVKIFNNNGEPMIVEYTQYYPPDVTACIFWLKNRDPLRWRDRHEVRRQSAGPLQISQLTDVELLAIIAGEANRGGE